MNTSTGILLVNLGTPDSPDPKDVYRYLIEFLTDGRVIDMPWLSRQLLVRAMIVPSRYRQSARSYQHIWTAEGSPLKVYGRRVEQKLQNLLGNGFLVKLAMRYQNPSIEQGIDSLMTAGVDRLLVLPLFPQYASATTGSVHECVMSVLKRYPVIPELTLLNHYATHPGLIGSFCTVAKEQCCIEDYDHILFSFHGLPQRHISHADRFGKCLKNPNCCSKLGKRNKDCYSAQCYATAREIVKELQLDDNRYSISFQSRLGKDPWLQPYTSEKVVALAKAGYKRVLVFCPAFVCDCLETIFEIGVEYAAEFKHAGGDVLELVQGLNDHPQWIQALKQIVLEHTPKTQEEIFSSQMHDAIPLEALTSLCKNVC